MEKLRKQIRESFFNPILHFLPLLIFLVVEDSFGMFLAWRIAFPIAIALLIYMYFRYNRIFIWHLISTIVFLNICIVALFEFVVPVPYIFRNIFYEIIVAGFFFLYLMFEKQIQAIILKLISKLIPMTNNFAELKRVIIMLLYLMLFYIIGNLALSYLNLSDSAFLPLFKYTYLGLLIFLIIYEIMRVSIIRGNLMREEWWPIVNNQGKIIGSIQHLTSLNDEKKYMHPIARVLLIDKGMILMQKRSNESIVFPGLWDTAISNHLSMGETIDQCIERTALERYSLTNFKYMYLSNYSIEVEKEHHYAFLFVSCQESEFKLNTTFTDQLKWWTQQQIEADLNTGIFTENFKVEYDLLKRSGLLENGKCECNCRLKDVIYQQSNSTKIA